MDTSRISGPRETSAFTGLARQVQYYITDMSPCQLELIIIGVIVTIDAIMMVVMMMIALRSCCGNDDVDDDDYFMILLW